MRERMTVHSERHMNVVAAAGADFSSWMNRLRLYASAKRLVRF